MGVVDFTSTRVRLQAHVAAAGVGGKPFVAEAITRLDQLAWLCDRIARVERDAMLIDWVAWQKSNDDGSFHPWLVELQTLTEAFYYIAWRLIAARPSRSPQQMPRDQSRSQQVIGTP